jgi:hypothetical protein
MEVVFEALGNDLEQPLKMNRKAMTPENESSFQPLL